MYDLYGPAGERYIRERGRWGSDVAQIYQRVSAAAHGAISREMGDSTGIDRGRPPVHDGGLVAARGLPRALPALRRGPSRRRRRAAAAAAAGGGGAAAAAYLRSGGFGPSR